MPMIERATETTDEELAALFRTGDESARERLAERYEPLVKAIVRRTTIPGLDEDDVRVEASIALRHAIATYRPGAKGFPLWAVLILDRHMVNVWRRRPKLHTVPMGSGDPDLAPAGSPTPEDGDAEQSLITEVGRDLRSLIRGQGSEAATEVLAAYRHWRGEPAELAVESIDVFLLSRRYLRARQSGTQGRDVAPELGIPRDLGRALGRLWETAARASLLVAA